MMADELNTALAAFPWSIVGGLIFATFLALVVVILFAPNPRA